jgi:hypothetical protein
MVICRVCKICEVRERRLRLVSSTWGLSGRSVGLSCCGRSLLYS